MHCGRTGSDRLLDITAYKRVNEQVRDTVNKDSRKYDNCVEKERLDRELLSDDVAKRVDRRDVDERRPAKRRPDAAALG